MTPQPLIADDASSTCFSLCGDTVSTSSSAGRVRAASHPLQMMGGAGGECSTPASDPLGDSSSSAMSLSSERSAGVASPRQSLSSSSSSPPPSSSSCRRQHRSSLSSQAFKVHKTESVRRASNEAADAEALRNARHLEDLVASLRKQLDAALRAGDESKAQAKRFASHCRDLERENASLKTDLAKAKEEGREHRSLARKVVKDNARLMREANERQADAQRLSNLAEKVRTLSSNDHAGAGPGSRRGSVEQATSAPAAVAPAELAVSNDGAAQLDAVNLSNECESLRRENARLREEAQRMEAALSASMYQQQSEPEPQQPLRRRASTEDSVHHRGIGHRRQGSRVAALKKMASIRGMTSMLNINDSSAAAAGCGLSSSCHEPIRRSSVDADLLEVEVESPEDFLWDE